MQFGRLFLAGDAAHIVPPTGAKGLNLAASDVAYLSDAMIAHFRRSDAGLRGLSGPALPGMEGGAIQLVPDEADAPLPRATGPFERRMQIAELDYIAAPKRCRPSIAENYVGLPL